MDGGSYFMTIATMSDSLTDCVTRSTGADGSRIKNTTDTRPDSTVAMIRQRCIAASSKTESTIRLIPRWIVFVKGATKARIF